MKLQKSKTAELIEIPIANVGGTVNFNEHKLLRKGATTRQDPTRA